MENITPNSATPPPVQTEPIHKLNWLRWLMILVIIAILSIVTTIIVTNSQFKNQPQPTSTPIASTPTPTTDKTANWKTYANSRFNYQIKYPSEWKILESYPTIDIFPPEFNADKPDFPRSITIEVIDTSYAPPPPSVENNTLLRSINTNELGKIDIVQSANQGGAQYKTTVRKNKFQISFYFGSDLNRKYDPIFDQILSTFKFLDQAVTPTPIQSGPTKNPNQVVCTQDVKQCPDGSYVGRQPPNCEFAPCP